MMRLYCGVCGQEIVHNGGDERDHVDENGHIDYDQNERHEPAVGSVEQG